MEPALCHAGDSGDRIGAEPLVAHRQIEDGPELVRAILYGMEVADVPLPGQFSGRFPQQSFICPTVLIPSGERHRAAQLKSLFDTVRLEAGSPLGSPSFNSDGWTRYAGEERLGAQ